MFEPPLFHLGGFWWMWITLTTVDNDEAKADNHFTNTTLPFIYLKHIL